MGRSFCLAFDNPHNSPKKIFGCVDCQTHLTADVYIFNKNFRGRTGPAWLFNRVINVSEGQRVEREMTTGLHTIVDIYCNVCGTNLGWKYEDTSVADQKYKKGKFILEKALLVRIYVTAEGQEQILPLEKDDDI
eukprot:GHVS01035285.1.p1 GENE.GHVS01035285.1~~GHVS01035285.1.p1  ORF type:complete len:134 (-),score=10.35 GHVS01035285.1:382-783(-)